jgi:WD40 repeat protein
MDLAEEFLARYRKGERPPLREYIDRHPELAAEIKEVFPAMAMMEKIALADESLDEPTPKLSGLGQHPQAFQQMGDFRIIREVGHGGMGLVYEAEQVSLGRHVALKVLPDKALLDPKHKRRFEREARAAAKLHHTNIVPVFGVGEHEGLPYYVMQLIQGMGLDAVLDELRYMQPTAAHTPSSLPVTRISPAGRDISAAEVARSLMTGAFRPPGSDAAAGVAQGEPTVTMNAPDVAGAEAVEPEGSARATDSAPHRSSVTPTDWIADSFTASSSSITFPGSAGPGSRKQNYWQSVAHVGRQVADALAYAHKQGVLHRDIKPSNLLLDMRGTVWVTDFGLAKISGPGAEGDDLTHTGDFLGTLRYMPPEAFEGKGDARGDIYSLGLTLYEMLTLRPAYEEKDRHKLIKQVTLGEPAALDKVNPQVPRDLVTIIHKAVAREPGRRYQAAEELTADLQRFLDDEPILARRQTQLERYVRWARHNPGIALLGAALTAVLVLATVASLAVAGYMTQAAAEERAARLQASMESAEADRQRNAAQLARKAEEAIAAQANAEREQAQRENYRSTIMLAESMLQGDAQAKYGVTDLLWGAQPELRGWEWGYLMARCPLEEWSLQTDQGGLDQVAASPDGRWLATAGVDGTVALWDSWTRKQLWRQKTGRVHSLDLDSQSRYVGVGTADELHPLIQVLDRSNGSFLCQQAATSPASVAFGPSGRDFYVCTGKRLERFSCQKWATFAPAASTQLTPLQWIQEWVARKVFVDLAGAYVGVHDTVSRGARQSLLFDAHTLRPVTEFDAILGGQAGPSLQSASTPVLHSALARMLYTEGPELLTAVLDRRPRKTNDGAGEPITFTAMINHLAYDPVAETGMVAGNDGTVRYFERGRQPQTLWHGSAIIGLSMLSDGRFVTAGASGLLKCWKRGAAGKLAVNTDRAPDSASANVLAFAGQSLLYQNWVRNVHFLFGINPPSRRVFKRPESGNYGIHFPAIRPRRNEMVVDSPDGLSFYSLRPEAFLSVARKPIPISRPRSVAFDASGRIMVANTEDGKVAIFDLDLDQRLPDPEARGPGVVAINAAGKRAALLTEAGLQVWDVATGRMLQPFAYETGAGPILDTNNGNMAAPVFHPDGELIAFIEKRSTSRSLVLWDTTRGQRRALVRGEPGVVFPPVIECQVSCVFSADGNRVFIPCEDAKVRIWDWRLGKELLALSDARQTVQVAAAPDGVTIAYAGWAPSLRIAMALPWQKSTQRDVDFFRAVDDFRIYSTHFQGRNVTDELEMLGDIHLRRDDITQAKAYYDKEIANREQAVLQEPKAVQLQSRLAQLYEKYFAASDAGSANGGTDALERTVRFWQSMKANGSAEQYLLRARSRLVDRRPR